MWTNSLQPYLNGQFIDVTHLHIVIYNLSADSSKKIRYIGQNLNKYTLRRFDAGDPDQGMLLGNPYKEYSNSFGFLVFKAEDFCFFCALFRWMNIYKTAISYIQNCIPYHFCRYHAGCSNKKNGLVPIVQTVDSVTQLSQFQKRHWNNN